MSQVQEPARATGSLRRQLVVISAVVTAVAVALLVVLVQLVLERTTSATVRQALDDRTDSVVSATRSASRGDELVVPVASLEAGVAVYDETGTLVAGGAPSALAEEYAELSRSTGKRTLTRDDRDVVRAQPFALDSGVRGVVVVTEGRQAYERIENQALLAMLGTGVLAVVASGLLAAWVSRRALAPVVAMAETAADWSEHDLASRFDLGPPTNEITALGNTLDTLLDKVAAAIRSEQRLTAELAHELRTPLTAIQGTADLLDLRTDLGQDAREDVAEIRAASRRMAETVTGLLQLARAGTGADDVSVSDLGRVVDGITAALPPGGGAVAVDVPPGTLVGLPEALAARALGPVVGNAVRLAPHVRVSVRADRSGVVAVHVDDDGPGVDPALREAIFEPGHTTGEHGGVGLGLPLARRIARSAGGDVTLGSSDSGASFVVELPRG